MILTMIGIGTTMNNLYYTVYIATKDGGRGTIPDLISSEALYIVSCFLNKSNVCFNINKGKVKC